MFPNRISIISQPETSFNNTQSLTLDGTGDYVDFLDLDIVGGADGEGDYSVSAWFKTSTEDANMVVVSKGNTPRWHMYIQGSGGNANKMHFEHYIDGSNNAQAISNSASATQDGNWHHCLVTAQRDGNLIMYINGTAQTTSPSIASLTSDINQASTKLVVGTYSKSVGSKPWNGQIDEVAIWDAVLSAADATAIYNSGKPNDLTKSASYATDRTGELVAYWRFEGDYTDSSDNSNSGTAVADATFSTDVP